MFLITTGKFLVKEIGVELLPGRLMGELGFVTPNNKRTQTVECIEDGAVMTITYDRLLEVYFDNPDFGYFFLRLSSDRLLQNMARMEATIEDYKLKLQAATAANRRKTCLARAQRPWSGMICQTTSLFQMNRRTIAPTVAPINPAP